MKKKLDKKKIIRAIGFYLTLVALCFIRSLSTYVFVVPNSFAPGGVSGIASIVYNAILPTNPSLANTWFNPAVTVFIMNVPLLVIAFKYVNRQFAINTTLGVIFYSLFMGVFSLIRFPQFVANDTGSSYMILAALAGGVIAGVALGLMLLLNISVGGTDIIGRAIYERNPVLNTNWLIFVTDCLVVLASGILGFITSEAGDSANAVFVKVMTPVFYSFITLFTTSKVAEIIDNGIEGSVVFNIITDKYDEIADAIVANLKRGATIISGEGHYTHAEKHIVICVVKKRQLNTLKRIVKSVDSTAFVYITTAREVAGKGFIGSGS